MNSPWKFELFGHLQIRSGDILHTRFYSQKVASLVARLAYFPNRQFGREELIEMFWPDSDLRAGRANLRTALASLRKQLEPPGSAFGNVLVADYNHVSLNPIAFTSDVLQFDSALNRAQQTSSPEQKSEALQTAYALYAGELLPGFYDDWMLHERERRLMQWQMVAQQLRDATAANGDFAGAIDYARRLVATVPLDEEANLSLIDLLVRSRQTATAQQQYHRFWKLYTEQMCEPPSAQACRRAAEWNFAGIKTEQEQQDREKPGNSANAPSVDAHASSLHPKLTPSPATSPQEIYQNFPLTLTRTFGRQLEIAAICDQLSSPHLRILTLTGIGGIGKTRLAIDAARKFAEEFSGRVVFVSLADISDPALIPIHLLGTIGSQTTDSNVDALTQLAQILRITPTLLILDNFEHLLPDGVDLLLTLLARIASLRCLITSRQRLDIEGEQIFPLAPLPFPADDDAISESLGELSRVPSMQLLLDRAQSVRPDFQLTIRNADALAAICRRLEGLPLALELAAARLQVVTAAQMLAELQNRLDFLVARRRNVLPRHRSLRAMLDWSYHLLPSEQQIFLAQLAIFRGGWTVEAATAICEVTATLTRLEELYACSLIELDESEEGIRFHMCETVREYASEKLTELQLDPPLWQRYLHHYTQIAKQVAVQIEEGHYNKRVLDALEAEHDNVRNGLLWCLANGEIVAGMRLATAMTPLWIKRGHQSDGIRYLLDLLDKNASEEPTILRTQALISAGSCAVMRGELDRARDLLQTGLTLAERLGDDTTVAKALSCLGECLRTRGENDAAIRLLSRSLSIYREQENPVGIATTLTRLACLYTDEGDLDLSLQLFQESIALSRKHENRSTLTTALGNLAALYYRRGLYQETYAVQEENIALRRSNGDSPGLAYALLNTSPTLSKLGAGLQSIQVLEEAKGIFQKLGNSYGYGTCLLYIGDHLAALERAAGAKSALIESLDVFRDQRLIHQEMILCGIEVLARVERKLEAWHRSATLYGAAFALRAATNFRYFEANRLAHETERALVRSQLSESDWNACWTKGTQMSWQESVDFALNSSTK